MHPQAAAKALGKGAAGPGALTTLPSCLGDDEIVEAVVLEPGTEKPWLMTHLGLSHLPARPLARRLDTGPAPHMAPHPSPSQRPSVERRLSREVPRHTKAYRASHCHPAQGFGERGDSRGV